MMVLSAALFAYPQSVGPHNKPIVSSQLSANAKMPTPGNTRSLLEAPQEDLLKNAALAALSDHDYAPRCASFPQDSSFTQDSFVKDKSPETPSYHSPQEYKFDPDIGGVKGVPDLLDPPPYREFKIEPTFKNDLLETKMEVDSYNVGVDETPQDVVHYEDVEMVEIKEPDIIRVPDYKNHIYLEDGVKSLNNESKLGDPASILETAFAAIVKTVTVLKSSNKNIELD